MATETADCLQQIGEIAGEVWHILQTEGGMSSAKLSKAVDAPRDVVMQAVGWLAREGKVGIEDSSRGRIVSLR